MSERGRDWLLAGLLFVSGFIFLGSLLHLPEGQIIAGSDLHWIFRATGEFAAESWRQGQIPFWNPYIFLGLPQFAEPQLSTFYPPMWLMAVASPAFTFAFLYALHVGLAAAGGYVLIRQLGGRWSGAVLGGLMIGYMPIVLVRIYVGHFPHLMTLAYMSWILAGATWAVKGQSWARSVLAGITLALAMLAGYAPFFPFLVGGVSLWFFGLAYQAWRRNGRYAGWRVLGQWLVFGLSAGLMAAVQLLPAVQFTLLSSRVAGATYEFASSMSLPFWALIRLVLPDVYGAPFGETPYWASAELPTYWEYTVYIGILPLLLLGIGLVYGSPRRWFWLGLAGIGLTLALGSAAALHRLFYDFVPGFGLFRVPARFIYFFGLGTAVVAAFAFDDWFDLTPEQRQRPQKWLWVIVFIFGGLSTLFLAGALLWQGAQTAPEAAQKIGAIANQGARLLLWGVFACLLLLLGHGQKRWLVVLLAALLLVFDLWGYSSAFLRTQPDAPEIPWVMADLTLPANRDDFRVLARWLGNGNILSGLYAVDGFDDFRIATGHNLALLALENENVARLLSAQYLLQLPHDETTPAAGWEVLTAPAGVTIYERADAFPRTWIVHEVIAVANEEEALKLIAAPDLDFAKTAVVQVLPNTNCTIEPGPPENAEVTSFGRNELIVRTNTRNTGWLILNDLYYPGWQAAIDGKPAPIQPTNYGLRGICLPPGEHAVVFRFNPPIFWVGLVLSIVGWGLALFAFVIVLREPSHNSGKVETG